MLPFDPQQPRMSTPEQLKAQQEEIIRSPAYRIAQEDTEFMGLPELRSVRLQLEYLKPSVYLRKYGIESTVVVFGSARIAAPEIAQADYQNALSAAEANPDDTSTVQDLANAKRRLGYSRYYEEARCFSRMLSEQFQLTERRDFAITTGGGPGIMEAANRGAYEAGALSIGHNITLPHEQRPNPYITPELAFHFHYFALRKMHLLLHARALVSFPGGYGTMDELFEVLTLIQTGKVERIPIILFGRDFWSKAINFDFLVEEGMIAPKDASLVTIVEKAEEAMEILRDFYQLTPGHRGPGGTD